jgi:hypothetical protein
VTGRHVGSSAVECASAVEVVLPILCHHSLELPIESVACFLSGFVAAVSVVQIIKIPALTGAFLDRSFVRFLCCRLVVARTCLLVFYVLGWAARSCFLPDGPFSWCLLFLLLL